MYKIDSFTSMHDCECCGTYSYKNVSIIYNEETVEEFDYESHFGNGNWNGSWLVVYANVLKHAGFKIIFSLVLTPEIDIETAYENSQYYQYFKYENLKEIEVDVVYKQYLYKNDNPFSQDNSYDLPVSFSFKLNDRIHKIETNDYEKFYIEAIKIITEIEICNTTTKSYI